MVPRLRERRKTNLKAEVDCDMLATENKSLSRCGTSSRKNGKSHTEIGPNNPYPAEVGQNPSSTIL